MSKNKYFEIYDKLIEKIPEDIIVENYSIGRTWSYVETKENIGLAMTVNVDSIPYSYEKTLIGKSLKEVAELSKSWNFREAAVGLAAINAFYNTEEKVLNNNGNMKDADAFDVYRNIVKGKKVSVIGHFPFLERQIKDICDLYIIEKNPLKGDYPDSSCEVLLPESDFIFITSSTIVNKTFPRLIELGKGKKIIMVGPSTPLSEILFKYGIYDLSGFIVNDKENLKKVINNGVHREFFNYGKMLSIKKKES